MRKLYSGLFVVLVLMGIGLFNTTAAYAASVTVRPETVQAAPGSEVEIPITIQHAAGIGAMELVLAYDPAILEPKTVDNGALLSDNSLLNYNSEQAGRLVIGIATLDYVRGNGALVNTHFVVLGNEGQTSPLRLENAHAWEGENRLDVMVNPEAGEFTVSRAGLPMWLLLLVVIILIALILVVVQRKRHRQAK